MSDQSYPLQGRHVGALAALYALRMLGLFMVLPVLVLFAGDYRDSSPFLLGVALGAYGFSQALLQIPFGLCSDRWGRRPVIAAGLLIFAGGSVMAALAESIYGLILGRFLQGAGAIASALMAMVGDLTSERHRSKAMAAIGAAIGLSFSLALILGPALSQVAGLAGIFWLTAILALVGLALLFAFLPPSAPRAGEGATANTALLGAVLRDRQLLRLDWGILCLHFILMANFVVLPTLLSDVLGLPGDHHWWVYLPILAGAFILMLPLMLLAERRGRVKALFLTAVGLLGSMQLLLAWAGESVWLLLGCLFLFFLAFNLLEAKLPSLVSKFAHGGIRGTANGIYSSSQFAGAFLGGSLGGVAAGWGGPPAVFALCAVAALLWWLAALGMSTPEQLTSVLVALRRDDRDRTLQRLLEVPGVSEVAWLEEEGLARLWVDRRFRPEAMEELAYPR